MSHVMMMMMISATGHPIHFMLASTAEFFGRRTERRYFRLDQIQDWFNKNVEFSTDTTSYTLSD